MGTADEVAPTTSEPNERVKRKVGQSSRRATTHRDRHERFTEGLDFGDSTDSLRFVTCTYLKKLMQLSFAAHRVMKTMMMTMTTILKHKVREYFRELEYYLGVN